MVADQNDNVYLSSRNLPKVNVVVADQISTYDVLNAKSLVLSEGAVAKIEKVLNN